MDMVENVKTALPLAKAFLGGTVVTGLGTAYYHIGRSLLKDQLEIARSKTVHIREKLIGAGHDGT